MENLHKKLNYNIIIAVCKKGGIGFEGKLSWNIKQDLKYFANITTKTFSENESSVNKPILPSSLLLSVKDKLIPDKESLNTEQKNIVVMGRKTWESIPNKFRPLKNRINVVLSKDQEFLQKNPTQDKLFYTAPSLSKFFELAQELDSKKILHDIFVIGGSQIYQQFISEFPDQLKAIFLTNIENEYKCDTFFTVPKNFSTVYISKTFSQDNSTNYDFRVLLNDDILKKCTGSEFMKVLNPYYVSMFPKHQELQYIDAIADIIQNGVEKSDRTGTGTKSKFGLTMRYDLSESFPLLTTKDTFWRGIAEELLWFIKGDTNAKHLNEKKVKIWDGNASRKYLDSIGLTEREEWDLGPVYGFQWRHFGAEYKTMHDSYENKGIDQLKGVIEDLKNNPDSRRIILCAWNPKDLKLMALPPCHILCQFYVMNKKLSLQMYQRSADMGLGVPFNIASYSLLLMMVAQVTGLEPGEFVHVIGDAHVYLNHVDALKEQIKREPKAFPLLKLNKDVKNIEDFTFKDFEIVNYNPLPKIKMEMAV